MTWRILVNWQEQQKTNHSKFPYLPIDVSCWLVNQVQHTRVCGWAGNYLHFVCDVLDFRNVLAVLLLLKANIDPSRFKQILLTFPHLNFVKFVLPDKAVKTFVALEAMVSMSVHGLLDIEPLLKIKSHYSFFCHRKFIATIWYHGASTERYVRYVLRGKIN